MDISDPNPSELENVLTALRAKTEVDLHKEVIGPLLGAMGFQNIRYVHGSYERGKDFLYTYLDPYRDVRLCVCQVKNQPFSGRAMEGSSTYGVLNQLGQARETEVLNPVTHKKEMPESVVLMSTYPILDRDTADLGVKLKQLGERGCKIISPEKLVELLGQHLPELYSELAHPGQSTADSLRRYVSSHHEAHVFDISRRIALDQLFINVGVTSAGQRQGVSRGLPAVLQLNETVNQKEFNELQSICVATAGDRLPPPVIVTGDGSGPESVRVTAIDVRPYGFALASSMSRGEAHPSRKGGIATPATVAIQSLAHAAQFYEYFRAHFPEVRELIERASTGSLAPEQLLPPLELPEVPPSSLLSFVVLLQFSCLKSDQGMPL